MIVDALTNSLNFILYQTKLNLSTLGVILLIPWAMFFVIKCISDKFLLLGIIPRRIYGVLGILFAPILHADFNHLFFNSVPLFVLSDFILVYGLAYYLKLTLIITVLSGAAIWCFARPGLYVGASALITGYWGFLASTLYYDPINITSIILALLSIYFFAGIFFGIFPQKKGVSAFGHLLGLLAGIAAHYLMGSGLFF